tara:strand:+ start:18598 stop:20235 length:1638 start_codon:yes stop_codon:yes gene_type:complete
MLTPDNSTGRQAIFILQIDFMGQTYRFAQAKIDLGDLSYDGELRDFAHKEQSQLIGIDIEANTINCAVCFDNVDLVKKWRSGHTLDGSTAELSFVLQDDDNITAYDDRIVTFSGVISQPVIGDPLEPSGFAAFSIEQRPFDFSETFLNPEHVITKTTFSQHDTETAGGKPYPFIFGTPGQPRSSDGATVDVFCTPAYMSRKAAGNYHMLIAGHPVEATQVKIQDEAGNTATLAVVEAVDARGQPYSYIDVTTSAIVYPGKTLLSAGENASVSEWWCSWVSGGGFKNPFGDGVLTGGGDVCQYALLLTRQTVDFGAWANVSNVINAYQFSGYINDPEVTAWDWVSSNILPFLPVEVVSGPKGIRPILASVYASSYLQPVANITADREFYIVDAIKTQTDISDIINRVSLRFAKGGFDQDFVEIARVGDFEENNQEQRSDIYAQVSKNKFGELSATLESEYVYDRDTAFLICHTMVRSKSAPLVTLDYQSDIHFGYLMLGDLITLTDNNLYLDNTFCTVVSKQWTGVFWRYILAIQDTPIQLGRYND